MTEKTSEDTILLAGRVVGYIRPTQGQLEAMVRIAKALQRGTDDDPQDFWTTQVDRIGTLLESLIVEKDQDLVTQLYLTGKVDHRMLLNAIFSKMREDAEASEEKAIVKAKANTARVQRK